MNRDPRKYLVRKIKSPLDGKALWWGAIMKDGDDGEWWYSYMRCSEDWEEVIAWIQHREMTRKT